MPIQLWLAHSTGQSLVRVSASIFPKPQLHQSPASVPWAKHMACRMDSGRLDTSREVLGWPAMLWSCSRNLTLLNTSDNGCEKIAAGNVNKRPEE